MRKPTFTFRKSMTGPALFLASALICAFCTKPVQFSQQDYEKIQEGFITPADTNKPWCYYYWIGDDISKEGITRDLEAMRDFGLGAVFIGNINPDEVDGPVPLFSDAWWDAMVHVVNEGHRLGIDVGLFNCPGWSQSGGPWVTYDKAMRYLVYTEATAEGPGEVTLQLIKPAKEFQDTYVLAFRKIQAEKNRLTGSNATVNCKPAVHGTGNWLDGDAGTGVLFHLEKDAEYTIDIQTSDSFTARSLLITPAEPPFKCDIAVLAEVDGSYKTIQSFTFDRSNINPNVGPATHGPVSVSLPALETSGFRLVCKNLVSSAPEAGFSEILITETPMLQNFIEKALGKMHPTPMPEFNTYMWESQEAVSDKKMLVTEVLDLSDRLDGDGILTWDVPEGEWTILRMGMTPTGTKNSPAAPQGKGYEIDKASTELAQFHFDNYMAEIIRRIPKENLPALKYVIADSYEMGSQNWTDGFAEKFKNKFGYDPVKYLPVISGRVVGSVEESDRFLWDLRRSVADDVAYQYVGGLRKAAHAAGLKTWLENYGHWGYPGEFLMYGGQSDLIGGEFWEEGGLGQLECKSASSAAHIYGKPVTSAEAFTAAYRSYTRYPALLKRRGDWSWTLGINHFVLHVYIHQPRDKAPGNNAWFSTEFNRLNTWFKQGKAWVDYFRRCQHMLQQGKYAADVIYFIGEDAPKMTGIRDPELPAGYSYDYINAEVILERLTVKNGKFVLPDGMNYSILVLPENTNMRPAVLVKMEELVRAGGVILGANPEKSPSLKNYPECDQEIRDIANRMWGEDHESGKLQHAVGNGFVLDGMDLQQALDFIKIPGDINFPTDAKLLWTHRTMPGMDIYFLTNQSDGLLQVEPSFRVSGFQPQLWDAVTGRNRKLNDFIDDGSRTTVPLSLQKAESCFIVFTSLSNDRTGSGYSENFPEPEVLTSIESAWELDFNNKESGPKETIALSKLADWTKSEDELIKYYSGTATYSTTFKLETLPEEGDLFLDLGKVGMMAKVTLNGQDLGTAWIDPYRLLANEVLRVGENKLEVEVVNVWRNRMVGDLELPENKRFTTTSWTDVKAGEELMASGLLGPVQIEVIR